uniref:response regulator n=1 Tax=Miniimonas arenae TaxID=676201 RepID=UPI0028B1B491
MKILIADDDPQILRALRVTLRAHGYQVVTAADGTGAIHAAAAEHPDLLMVDLGMPGMTGMDVITAGPG